MTWLRNPITLGVIALLAVILLASTVAIVPETKQVVVVQFENPIGTVNRWKPGEALGQTGAGLMARIPLVDRLIWIDKRVLDLDLDNQPVLSTDQQRLEVDAFARFRIVDPLRLVQSMGLTSGTEDRVRAQLTPLFASALRSELGKVDFNALLSPERGQLMDNIQIALQRYARNYGVQIIDVRIKRADLPPTNEQAVFERMQTARKQEAAELRAIGEQKRREIVATAYEEAEKIRGDADARRAQLFAESFGRDPGFAAFYRSMSAYEKSLGQGDTTLVLSPDSAFFKYFEKGPAG